MRTQQEIESELRERNPSLAINGSTVTTGNEAYEAEIAARVARVVVEESSASARERLQQFPPATPRQVRVWLLSKYNKTSDDISTIIKNIITDPASQAIALVSWEYASAIERDNPLTDIIGTSLGLSSEEIDIAWQAILSI